MRIASRPARRPDTLPAQNRFVFGMAAVLTHAEDADVYASHALKKVFMKLFEVLHRAIFLA